MGILDVVIVIFIILEFANVVILYFIPDSKIGNGVAVFNQWFKSKEDESSELFAKYMASWVAGTKLIFVALLLVILFMGDERIKFVTVIVMILSISTYYFKLDKIIKKIDSRGELSPKGYSKTLFLMITAFILMFVVSLIVYIINLL